MLGWVGARCVVVVRVRLCEDAMQGLYWGCGGGGEG